MIPTEVMVHSAPFALTSEVLDPRDRVHDIESFKVKR